MNRQKQKITYNYLKLLSIHLLIKWKSLEAAAPICSQVWKCSFIHPLASSGFVFPIFTLTNVFQVSKNTTYGPITLRDCEKMDIQRLVSSEGLKVNLSKD